MDDKLIRKSPDYKGVVIRAGLDHESNDISNFKLEYDGIIWLRKTYLITTTELG